MEEYHKINALFKRYKNGPKKGKLIQGEWSTPEFEYLKDSKWEFTEKVDGTNIRVRIGRVQDSTFVEFGGRTDRAELPVPLLERLKNLFPESSPTSRNSQGDKIGQWMVEHDISNAVLFGEGYGANIQGVGHKYSERMDFVLFDVKVEDWWLDRDSVNAVAKTLGLDAVPVVGSGTLEEAIEIVSSGITFNDQGAIQRWGSGTLSSRWGNFDAEGIVARPAVPLLDRAGRRIITKIKKVDFK